MLALRPRYNPALRDLPLALLGGQYEAVRVVGPGEDGARLLSGGDAKPDGRAGVLRGDSVVAVATAEPKGFTGDIAATAEVDGGGEASPAAATAAPLGIRTAIGASNDGATAALL